MRQESLQNLIANKLIFLDVVKCIYSARGKPQKLVALDRNKKIQLLQSIDFF